MQLNLQRKNTAVAGRSVYTQFKPHISADICTSKTMVISNFRCFFTGLENKQCQVRPHYNIDEKNGHDRTNTTIEKEIKIGIPLKQNKVRQHDKDHATRTEMSQKCLFTTNLRQNQELFISFVMNQARSLQNMTGRSK